MLITLPRAKPLVCLLRYKLHLCPLQVDHQYTNFSPTQSNIHFSITFIPFSLSFPPLLPHFHYTYTYFTLTETDNSFTDMDPSASQQSFMHSKPPTSGLALTSSTPYKSQPSKLYKAFLDDPALSDLTICLSDRTVYAHRIVLCRGSEYFANMFTGRFQVSQMPTAPTNKARKLTLNQQESASNEIKLQEDDPNAMLALLRFLYGLPYDAEAKSKWLTSLQPHAEVYVVADKYQIEPLKETVAENMRKIITAKAYTHKMGFLRYCDSFKNSDDFFGALHIILEVTTTQDIHSRKVLVDFLIQNIDFFRKQNELLSLFKEYPELAVEIISHKDLETEAEGFWMCFSDDCDTNVPSCGACKVPFQPYYLRRYRYDDQWECQACKSFDQPICLECKARICWVPDPDCGVTGEEGGIGEESDMDLDDEDGAAAKASRGHAGR